MLPQKKTIIFVIAGIIYYLLGMFLGEQDYNEGFGRVIELGAILMLAFKGNRVENKVEIVSSKVTEVDSKLL